MLKIMRLYYVQQSKYLLNALQCTVNPDDETKKVSQGSVLFLIILIPFIGLYRLQKSRIIPSQTYKSNKGKVLPITGHEGPEGE